MMKITLTWDDAAQTIVRWDCAGFIGWVEYIRYVNETASMAFLGASGKAHSLMHIPFFTFPFPERPYQYMAQAILASQSYGLGIVVVAAPNPFTRLLLRWKLGDERLKGAFYVVSSLGAGRALLSEHSRKMAES
jgi:hypothetical protein